MNRNRHKSGKVLDSRKFWSTRRSVRHPLHPFFVHIPIGLWLASLIFDGVYLYTSRPPFATASYYCMAMGLLGVLLAFPTGLFELSKIARRTIVRRLTFLHMGLNLFVASLYAFNFFLRGDLVTNSVTPSLFFFSILSFSILSISTYVGGLLVYDYGVGTNHANLKLIKNFRDSKRAA